MTIALRLSNKPFTAEVIFRNGNVRHIDYAVMQYNAGAAMFFENEDGKGVAVLVGLSAVETIEVNETTQPVGGRQ